jgi:spermidine/putrescine transport system permease protein
MNLRDFRVWGLAPAIALMALTLVIPIIIVLLVSFSTRGAYGGFEWGLSGGGYVQILFQEGWSAEQEFNAQYILIVGRTLLLATLTTLICMLVSFPVAYAISQTSGRTKAILIYLVTLPFWVSMIVRVYAWIIILGKDGIAVNTLHAMGLFPDLDSLLFTNGAMLVGMVYSYLPLMILPVFAAIEKLDPAYIEASHDLYGSRWVALRRVILPLSRPGMVAGAILVFVPCLGAVLEPILLGGGKTIMMGNLIQDQFGGARNWPFGAALAIVLLVMVMLFLIIDAQRSRRSDAPI